MDDLINKLWRLVLVLFLVLVSIMLSSGIIGFVYYAILKEGLHLL